MLKEIILGKDEIKPLNPENTVFIVGAGISADSPSSLPLGDMLTKAYLDASIGVANREKFIRFWTEHFPCLQHCVHENSWEIPWKSTLSQPAQAYYGPGEQYIKADFSISQGTMVTAYDPEGEYTMIECPFQNLGKDGRVWVKTDYLRR